MKLPVPRPGLVIRYAFLWSHEADKGVEESTKDRPCVIVAAARPTEGGNIRVIVAPITSRPPEDTASLKIPPTLCQQLGLKSTQQWLRFDELNRFTWPGYDLRAIPDRDGIDYGMLPHALFEDLRSHILERQKAKRGRSALNRDEV